MLHLLSALFFTTLIAAAGYGTARLVRDQADAILRALLKETAPQPRPWPSRVRLVSASRPALVRQPAQHAAA